MHEIIIEDLDFFYDNKVILSQLNLNINSGEFISILGPSGCGKSTLLKLIAGLDTPKNGRIMLGNTKVESPGLERGVVFQDYSLFSWMTTGQNIELAVKQAYKSKLKNKINKGKIKEISFEYLKKVGVEEEYYKLPRNLSGGMRQRVAIARAFAIDPPVLLMDEPFGALDAITRKKLQELILSLWDIKDNKKTIIFVTHDIDEALLISERIIIMGKNTQGILKIIDIDKEQIRDRDDLYSNKYYLDLKVELIKLLSM